MLTHTKTSTTFSIGTTLNRGKIIPVFLPFAGCPFKCLYCAQDTQTGVGNRSVLKALKELKHCITTILENTISPYTLEIAFYGGTFTALSDNDFNACLNTFQITKQQLLEAGFTVYGRCSTRPDCLKNNERLLRIKETGIDLIELGIQSFDDDVLFGLGRGYTGECAKKACAHINKLGFYLGIQLMPSSPQKKYQNKTSFIKSNHKHIHLSLEEIGVYLPYSENLNTSKTTNVTTEISTQNTLTFHNDVRCALALSPACLRYYPCLVLEHTGLAPLWEKGTFKPWDLQTCVDALGYALFLAWEKEVPVIRLSVAYEESFEKKILAGARHPALGSLIKARALQYAFKSARENLKQEQKQQNFEQNQINTISANKVTQKALLTKEVDGIMQLYLPKNVQGYIFGEKNRLKKEWEIDILLKNIFFS